MSVKIYTKIHPSAIIDPKAELDSSVEVGAYSVIGADVKVDENTKIGSHVVLKAQRPSAKIIRFFSFRHLVKRLKIKSMQASLPHLKLATIIPFANSAPLIVAPFKIKA